MLKIKIFFKKNFSFIYHPLRKTLLAFYLKRREMFLRTMKDTNVATFSFGGISFPLLVKKENGFVDQEIFWKGCYEEEVLASIKKHLPKDGVFVDIGANIGDHTLFSSYIANTGKVIAFEPIPAIFHQIEESVLLNKEKGHAVIELHNIACGKEKNTLTLSIPKDNVGGSSLIRRGEVSLQVSIEKADVFLEKESRIDLIKIDTEGFEYDVLLGLEETIKKHSPSLIIEYSPQLYKLSDDKKIAENILLFLKKHHYSEGIDEPFPLTSNPVDLFTKNYDQINILCSKK
jgi:FkbM family methyltransferase